MFWKKEKANRNSILSAWLQTFRTKPEPELFQYRSRERRKWFRIQPSRLEPIVLRIDDHKINIRDISAAGLSFHNDNFPIGSLESCRLDLPELGPAIPIKLQILAIDDKNICHCKFKTIEDGSVERIHQYILQRQKEILQKQKKMAMENRQKADCKVTGPSG